MYIYLHTRVIKWIKNPDNEEQAIKQMESRWDKNKFQAEKEGLLEPEKVFQKVRSFGSLENRLLFLYAPVFG